MCKVCKRVMSEGVSWHDANYNGDNGDDIKVNQSGMLTWSGSKNSN